MYREPWNLVRIRSCICSSQINESRIHKAREPICSLPLLPLPQSIDREPRELPGNRRPSPPWHGLATSCSRIIDYSDLCFWSSDYRLVLRTTHFSKTLVDRSDPGYSRDICGTHLLHNQSCLA